MRRGLVWCERRRRPAGVQLYDLQLETLSYPGYKGLPNDSLPFFRMVAGRRVRRATDPLPKRGSRREGSVNARVPNVRFGYVCAAEEAELRRLEGLSRDSAWRRTRFLNLHVRVGPRLATLQMWQTVAGFANQHFDITTSHIVTFADNRRGVSAWVKNRGGGRYGRPAG